MTNGEHLILIDHVVKVHAIVGEWKLSGAVKVRSVVL